MIQEDECIPLIGDSPPKPNLSLLRVVLFTAALAGCQFAWSSQIGYSTKAFEEFGMSSALVPWAWIAGPVSGMIVQPLIGKWSDSIGVRKPFIITGAVLTITSMIVFSNAGSIGKMMNDQPQCYTSSLKDIKSSDCPVSLAVSIISFALLDFSINAIQGPIRTLLVDLSPPTQQEQINAWFAYMASFGNLSATLLGSLDLVSIFPLFGSQITALYSIGALFVLLSTLPVILLAKERCDAISKGLDSNRRVSILKAWNSFPDTAKNAFWVNFCTWYAFFTMFIYATSWVGSEVFHGSPSKHALKHTYDRGVRLGNLGLSIQAGLAMLSSIQFEIPYVNLNFSILLWCIRQFGAKYTYLSSQFLLAFMLFLTMVAHVLTSVDLAIALIALTGWAWACTMTIPWSIAGKAVEDMSDRAFLMSLMNLSQCIPEILASLIGSLIMLITGKSTFVLMSGGVSAFIGSYLIVFLKVGDSNRISKI